MDIKISVPKAPPPKPVMPPWFPPHISIIWERYPRIGEKISLMWGYAELQKYLGTIILDERGGRLGFPEPVLTALLELHWRHSKMVPENSMN